MEIENGLIEDNYDSQFGYEPYYDSKLKSGWLLSYNLAKNESDKLFGTLYLVDDFSNNFKIVLPYFPSLLIEIKNELQAVEEYLRKKYEGSIHEIQTVERIDFSEFNHLNKKPKQFLKVYFKTETSFQVCIKNLREIINETSKNRHKNEIYSDFCQEKQIYEVTSEIIQIHEHDIPNEIQFGIEYKIRCGIWLNIVFNGKDYLVEVNKNKVAYPDLRVFAFDIETTKAPLKFPKAEIDEVMMISIMTEDFGELIINRNIVSQDIQEFEYHAKDEMKCTFRIFNEDNEEALLIRFLEAIIEYKPHIITTYNGGYFDWPFIDERMKKYNLSLETSLNFKKTIEYYECSYIIHLDCYKWVKRDSYLPMNSQGLKAVTKIKLGYFPDEIDPEDMLRCAKEEPQKLASYSVSDAVATFYLYLKYVQSHIFSVSSLIPLPPVQILCRGAGTLCESLLLAESVQYNLLIPSKKKLGGLEYYEGHIVENLTYVGGHVESLKAGIFRSDFEQKYTVNKEIIDLIIENLDIILEKYLEHPEYSAKREQYIKDLEACAGDIECKGSIYHLDVGAMYPNIILTNRMQPYAVVNEDVCIRCDFNNESNNCKRKLKWVSRAEYYPPAKNEVNMIKNQLETESFVEWNGESSYTVSYKDLPEIKQESILKERVIEYSKSIYKRTRKTEEKEQDVTICQRAVPFYVETVRKFRDQRNVYKELFKKATLDCEKCPNAENKKKLIVFNSLQIAYKCILNSFYGYVMREGSRWYSLEMAATVCNIGGKVIILAKEFVQNIGIPLELDTDGIWGIFPEKFPFNFKLGDKNISVLALALNYFVCKTFTNSQFQVLNSDGKYETKPQNSIFFEIDGPYKTMVIPSSTEENKLLKKRYVVFDEENKISELKGFELKRKGELNFIKKFQEDIFSHFNDGTNLQDCYNSLSIVCNYWLDIIEKKGGPLDEDEIFEMFSESRSMSKNIESYGDKKSNILGTARKLSEFLGNDILEEKLKCEFIMSKFPLNSPVADRAIPVMIFKSTEKAQYLKKWLKTSNYTNVREIIDWDYYRKRFESILQRMIVIPAYLQKISNPVSRIEVPSWAKDAGNKEKLKFTKTEDIEDIVKKRKLKELFYNTDQIKIENIAQPMTEIIDQPVKELRKADPNLRMSEFIDYINFNKEKWLSFYVKRVSYETNVMKIEILSSGQILKRFLSGRTETSNFLHNLYVDVAETEHFLGYEKADKYICSLNCTKTLFNLKIDEFQSKKPEFTNFFNHFTIKSTYSPTNPMFELLAANDVETDSFDILYLSSFNYMKKAVFSITTDKTIFISDLRHPSILRLTLQLYKETVIKNVNVIVVCKSDPNLDEILQVFDKKFVIFTDLAPQIFLESFESLMKIQSELHMQMKFKFQQLFDLSRYSKIPILNIDENVLDYMLYKEFSRNDCISVENTEFSPGILREELIRPKFYNSYCISFECSNSQVLSIIEYKTVSAQHLGYHGYQRKDFQVLRNFIKNMVISALNNNLGTRNLLQNIGQWLKKTSKIISPELRETIEIVHQQFLVGLISKLKKNQYSVIAASKELIVVDTGKSTREGADLFAEYLKKKISGFEGFELLNFKILQVFEKLGFVDFDNYFAVENNEFSIYSDKKLSNNFLKLYFSDEEIKNETVYSMVKDTSLGEMKMMLRLLSYKRDTHGLASNCYKLKKSNEFEEPVTLNFNLSIFCKKCGFENLLRKNCLKCYSQFDKESIEKECIAYLRYCWKMNIHGDLYCNKCGNTEERKLKEYCCCGGKYIRKNYNNEIQNLKSFVGTKKFDLEIENYQKFFK